MKRTWINRRSDTNRQRAAEAKPIRQALIAKHGSCMICGAGPRSTNGRMASQNQLCCHEVLNGGLRQKTLDEPCSLLVLCWHCNQNEVEDKGAWPHARQLAVLQEKSPEDYDLERFCFLRNAAAPRYIEQHEVDFWREQMYGPGK